MCHSRMACKHFYCYIYHPKWQLTTVCVDYCNVPILFDSTYSSHTTCICNIYTENCSPGPTGASPLVNITECSVSRVSFTLIQQINLQSDYTFFAACSRENGTCVSVNTN